MSSQRRRQQRAGRPTLSAVPPVEDEPAVPEDEAAETPPEQPTAPEPEAVFDPLADMKAAYEAADARAKALRKEWEERGSPFLSRGSTGQVVPHPLLKMIEQAEAHAAKLGRELAKRKPGAPPKATVNAKIGPSPAQQLRMVISQ